MKSISLAYGLGWRNSGDMSINQGSIKYINKLYESTTPRVISIQPEESEEFEKSKQKLSCDGLRYNMIGGPIHYDPRTQSTLEKYFHLSGDALRYALDLLNASILNGPLKSTMAQEIRNSDFLFYNGGNLIHHNRSIAYLLGILYPMQVAKRYNIPYGVLPHTIFDIEGRYEPLIRSLLEGAEFVWTRDGRSYDYLSSDFSLSTPVLNGLDTAFFLSEPRIDSSGGMDKEENPQRIAVVPRFSTLGDTGDLQEDDAEIQFKQFLTELTDRGHDVILTVQTKIEEDWVEQNQAILDGNNVDMFTSYDPSELRAHYDEVDLLVTMRLHAGIFALSVGTPAIGIHREEWGPKTPGTWENLGIKEFSLSHEEMTVKRLLALCERVFNNYSELQEIIKGAIEARKKYMITETSRMILNE